MSDNSLKYWINIWCNTFCDIGTSYRNITSLFVTVTLTLTFFAVVRIGTFSPTVLSKVPMTTFCMYCIYNIIITIKLNGNALFSLNQQIQIHIKTSIWFFLTCGVSKTSGRSITQVLVTITSFLTIFPKIWIDAFGSAVFPPKTRAASFWS